MHTPLVHIFRIEDDYTYGVFGVLLINGKIFCVTLEPCEYANKTFKSCIPAGCYELEKTVSQKFGTTYEVCNVPDRTHILLHRGNIVEHTEGCILLGEYFGKFKGNRAVLNSGKTFTNFMDTMHYFKTAKLIIKEMW